MRTVHINGQPWEYNIGVNIVNIWHPVTKKRYNVFHKDIVGYSDKNTIPVTPSKVKEYIETVILGLVPNITGQPDQNKQPLTLTKLRARVDRFFINVNTQGDNENWHRAEDAIARTFIRHAAKCDDTSMLKEMAKEVVKVLDTDYIRWYA